MKPKSVQIAGKEIPNVDSLSIVITTPVTTKGYHSGLTHAARVTIERRSPNTPMVDLFKAATNEDGKYKAIEGTIVLQNNSKVETYKIEMKSAHVQSWGFRQLPNESEVVESITLNVMEMKLSGSGNAKNFKVSHTNV